MTVDGVVQSVQIKYLAHNLTILINVLGALETGLRSNCFLPVDGSYVNLRFPDQSFLGGILYMRHFILNLFIKILAEFTNDNVVALPLCASMVFLGLEYQRVRVDLMHPLAD